MADQKISELTNITGANLANADEFVVVDVSADQTKAVTREQFFLSVPAITVSGKITADDLLIDSAGSAGIAFKPDGVTHTTFFARDSDDNFGIYDARNSRTWFRHIGHATTASQSLELLAGGGTLEISGNVGIGTDSPTEKLHVAGNAIVSGDVSIGDDLFLNGPNPVITLTDNDVANEYTKLTNSDGATILGGRNGASNGIILFRGEGGGVNDEYARFNAAGNFGIGTNAPQALLYVGGDDTILGGTAGNDINLLTLHADTSNDDKLQFTSERLTTGTDWTTAAHRIQRKVDASLMGYMQFGHFLGDNDLITFGENATEYMRIDGGGTVRVGTTSGSIYNNTTGQQGFVVGQTGTIQSSKSNGTNILFNRQGSNGNVQSFYKTGVNVGSISVTGSATAFNTTSDYRLKENVTPIQGAADVVMAMKPCTYTAIADGLWYDGFLAHELQEVHPRAVQGTKDAMMDEEYEVTPAVYEDVVTPAVDAVAATYDDEGIELTPAVEAAPETTESVLVTEAVMGTRSVPDMQSVDYSKLTPILTAALQEALTKIDALETRITALEG